MDGEHTERSAFALANLANIIMPASQLKGMANKEYIFFLRVYCAVIPALYFMQPGKISMLPVTSFAIERTARAATGNKNVVRKVGHF